MPAVKVFIIVLCILRQYCCRQEGWPQKTMVWHCLYRRKDWSPRFWSFIVGKPVLLLFEGLYNELFVTNYPRRQVVAGDGPILRLPAYLEKDAIAALIGRISFKNTFIFFPEIKF